MICALTSSQRFRPAATPAGDQKSAPLTGACASFRRLPEATTRQGRTFRAVREYALFSRENAAPSRTASLRSIPPQNAVYRPNDHIRKLATCVNERWDTIGQRLAALSLLISRAKGSSREIDNEEIGRASCRERV